MFNLDTPSTCWKRRASSCAYQCSMIQSSPPSPHLSQRAWAECWWLSLNSPVHSDVGHYNLCYLLDNLHTLKMGTKKWVMSWSGTLRTSHRCDYKLIKSSLIPPSSSECAALAAMPYSKGLQRLFFVFLFKRRPQRNAKNNHSPQ